MQRCSGPFTQTVSIHVAVPVAYEPSNDDRSRLDNFPLWSAHPCGQPVEFLGVIMKKVVKSSVAHGLLYPQNHMRNVARKTCGTPWVFVTDIDIIPRPNSAQMLQEFYNSPASNCSKCQFVIPTYELSRAVSYPESKQELIGYVRNGLARQFHLETYRYGQLATNYSLWAQSNLEESPIKISHDVGSIKHSYEPFYIGSDLIPEHDERFIGYGSDRISQVLEARVMGWTFKVLTPIFVIHWGFARRNGASRTRKAQQAKNYFIFKDFVAQLNERKKILARRNTGVEGREILKT